MFVCVCVPVHVHVYVDPYVRLSYVHANVSRGQVYEYVSLSVYLYMDACASVRACMCMPIFLSMSVPYVVSLVCLH